MTIREDADLHRAQRAFRCVLDAFAHPGTVHQLVPAPENPASPVALDASLELVVRLHHHQFLARLVEHRDGILRPVALHLAHDGPSQRRIALHQSTSTLIPFQQNTTPI